jgi:hypothetical protein
MCSNNGPNLIAVYVLPNDEFGVIVGEPVRFRFFGSKTRREDNVGTRLDYWSADELEELDERAMHRA